MPLSAQNRQSNLLPLDSPTHDPIRGILGQQTLRIACLGLRIAHMDWTYLIVAGLLEIVWAVGLKYTEGFSRLWPSVVTIGVMVASLVLLAQALKTIPVGTGYAVWTGIGAAGTAIVGIVFFGESRDVLRIVCLVLIVAGVVGLKFAAH